MGIEFHEIVTSLNLAFLSLLIQPYENYLLNAILAKQAFTFVPEKFISFILAHKDLSFFSLVMISL